VNIREKISALIASLFLALVVVELVVAENILLPSFEELERSNARAAMERINHALDQTLERLALSATDWGNWADTYRFVQDHNRTYVAQNLTNVALKQLNVNALLIVDRDGNIVLASDLDMATDEPLHIDLAAAKALPADFPWRANLRDGRPTQGYLLTNRGILMLAAAPVFDGVGNGPARGAVIMGRLLLPTEIQLIGSEAQAALAVVPQSDGDGLERLVEGDVDTQVYRTLNDLYGRPAITVRVEVPRQIILRGYSAVSYAFACLLAAAVVVLLLMVIALNRLVLGPLALITQHAVAIGEEKDLSARLNLDREDEIGVLAREIDHMVGRISESRRQLVDQSFRAGFAELARGVLHNLGNAMTPFGVRLTGLRVRLRGAHAEDAERALAELKRPAADTARRAQLEEFVLLACKELAATVKAAQEDVALLSGQTTIVQTALAELMRTTRNEHVIESVFLPDLVSDSLQIVPDSARQRLIVSADESLKKVGVVQVARTVLRLVLQNLVINAADAVREAGKDKGTLQVTAEIVLEDDRDQLHLQCKDDGIGITAENLERMFEKGFSTKPRETNHGIGLHWCANALSALGGRIWAVSDGPGRGASIHLMVPLAGRETTTLAGAA